MLGSPVLTVAGKNKTIGSVTIPASTEDPVEIFDGISMPNGLIAIILINGEQAIFLGTDDEDVSCPLPADTGIYLQCDGSGIYAVSQDAETNLGYIIISE